MNGSDTSEALEADSGGVRLALTAVLALGFAFLLGWGMVKIVDALEAEGGCGSYGYSGSYGGYGCEPDRTDASITVEPSSDLVDRQNVNVWGRKFDPHTNFGAVQCDAELLAERGDASACDLSTTAFGTTNADGNVVVTMRVRRVIQIDGADHDCAVASCAIGAATIPDGFNPLEGASAPISFDPDVPPVPALELAVTVDEVTTTHASGTATCNREAQLYLDLFVEQERGRHTGSAYGYSDTELTCDVEPLEWTIELYSDVRRLVPGRATYQGIAYAFDGFESAEVELNGTTRLTGSRRPPPIEPVATPGETVSVDVAGWSAGDNHVKVLLLVNCERPVDQAFATVQLSQWAGLWRINGSGQLDLQGCDGEEQIWVEVEPSNGIFSRGPAEVRATVNLFDFSTGFFDQARAVDRLDLRGRIRPPDLDLPPNPDSRITITSVTATTVTGTVECDGANRVFVDVSVLREVGRRVETFSGSDALVPCGGHEVVEPRPTTDSFSAQLYGSDGQGPGKGRVKVVVRAQGDIAQFPPPSLEDLWDDYQADTVRIRRA